MMMSFYFVLSFLFLSLLSKKTYVMSSIFMVDYNIFLLIFLIPVSYYMVNDLSFSKVGMYELVWSKVIYLVIFFLILMIFSSTYSLTFIILMECCVFFMMALIFIFSKEKDKVSSTFFMFFMNIFPSLIFIYFSLSLNFFISDSFGSMFFCVNIYFFVGFFLLLFSKLPMFFFHFWLLKAHVSASGAGSMILAGLMLKIASVGLYKYSFIFSSLFNLISNFIFSLILLSVFFLSFFMTRFLDVKHLIACSSIVHMAPIFFFCLSGYYEGIYASFIIMVGHGLVSFQLFFYSTLIYECSMNRTITFNKSLESFSKTLTFMIYFYFVMNLGFPPFAGFISEIYFFFSSSLFSIFYFFIFALLILLGGLIFFFLISKILFGKKNMEFFLMNFSSTYLIFFYFSVVYFLFPLFFLPF